MVDAGIMRRVIIEKPFHPFIIFTYPRKAFTTSIYDLSDSDSDAECPVCGLTFLEDDW